VGPLWRSSRRRPFILYPLMALAKRRSSAILAAAGSVAHRLTPAHAWPNRRSHYGRDGSDELRSSSTGVRRVSQTPRWLSQRPAPSARISARRFASASISALSEVCPSCPILRRQAGGSALQPAAEADRNAPRAGRHIRGHRLGGSRNAILRSADRALWSCGKFAGIETTSAAHHRSAWCKPAEHDRARSGPPHARRAFGASIR
jgi:hypothetical protein